VAGPLDTASQSSIINPSIGNRQSPIRQSAVGNRQSELR